MQWSACVLQWVEDKEKLEQHSIENHSHIPCLMKSDIVPVLLWNSRSIVNKLKQFNTFVHTSNYKIYGLTETWFSDHNNETFPPKFITDYRKDRSSRGGGVLLAIDMTLPSTILPSPDDIEVVAAEVQLSIISSPQQWERSWLAFRRSRVRIQLVNF